MSRLGIRTKRDLALFLVVTAYALAILSLAVGALARDLGLVALAAGRGRPIVVDLTYLTMALTAIMFGVAAMWIAFAFLSLRFRPTTIDLDSIEIHSPSVSVLIPAHNEESVVLDLVQDLLRQDYPQLEVLVIAHNCSDQTIAVVQHIQDPRLRVLEHRTSESGKALALNFGLAQARGDLVAQFDADNRIEDPRLVRRAVAYFLMEPQSEVIQSQVETKNAGANLLTRLQAMEYRMFAHLFWGGRNAVGLPCPVAGTGVFFRRAVLDRVGGWENELVEDFDLYCKLVLSRAKIVYKPDLVVLDEKPPRWELLIRQRSRWQRGHMEVLTKRWTRWMGLSDMLYLAAPVANAAWYASSIIILLYHTLPWSFTYWYPPAALWVSMWIVAYGAMALILVRSGHRRDLRYLPAFYIFGFHWLLAFLFAFGVKGWSSSKTPHGKLD